jgi:hypothetical protein
MVVARKRWRSGEVFTIRDERLGTVNVSREWTDARDPDPYEQADVARPSVDFGALVGVAELVEAIGRKTGRRG